MVRQRSWREHNHQRGRARQFEDSIFTAGGIDARGTAFGTEAGTFAYTGDMVANATPIDPFLSRDLLGMGLGQGRYFVPDVFDALDMIYPIGTPDPDVSEHLRKNGLRAGAMKRNGGSLITVTRADGKDALSEPLISEFDTSIPVPVNAGVAPVAGQLVDGDEVTWQDVRDSGLAQAYLDTYTLTLPGEPTYVQVAERSFLLQGTRERLGLPQRANGRSIEYQGYLDWWRNQAAIQALVIGLGELPNALSWAVDALGLAEPVFLEAVDAAGEGQVLTDIGRTVINAADFNRISDPGLTIVNTATLPPLTVIEPVMSEPVSVPLSSSAVTQLRQTALGQYRAQEALLQGSGYSKASAEVIRQVMRGISTDLGVVGAENAATGYLECSSVTSFPAVPRMGGNARGVFDVVGTRVLSDGRTVDVILEAKGGKGLVNFWDLDEGRWVVKGGQKIWAPKGSQAYIENVSTRMAAHPDPTVRAVGQRLRDKIALQKWDEIEY